METEGMRNGRNGDIERNANSRIKGQEYDERENLD